MQTLKPHEVAKGRLHVAVAIRPIFDHLLWGDHAATFASEELNRYDWG